MPSECETFWDATSYAVVGHQGSKKAYPKISYGALKERGKTVYAIDVGGQPVDGDKTLRRLRVAAVAGRGRRAGAAQGGDGRVGRQGRGGRRASRSGCIR